MRQLTIRQIVLCTKVALFLVLGMSLLVSPILAKSKCRKIFCEESSHKNNQATFQGATFYVKIHDQEIGKFGILQEAIAQAKYIQDAKVIMNGQTIWRARRESSQHLPVHRISQLPHLPRGCEIVSLAMVLNYEGIQVQAMELAEKIKKDPTPFHKSKGQVFFGNPHYGFVGDMFNLHKPGYGVYHEPIVALASEYSANVVDWTGCEFVDLLAVLALGHPIWVINNVYFDLLDERYWQTWQTPHGKIRTTYKEHSVVISGFDAQYVYVVDPLHNIKKVKRQAFERGWTQIGSQAVVVYGAK